MPKQKISKEELLGKLWRVFHRHGYHDTSLKMLCEVTGLGKAGLLHHFGSKQGMMTAVVDFAHRYYGSAVLCKLDGVDSLEDRLRNFLERHADLCRVDRRGCFFANVILETGAQQVFSEQLAKFHEQWIERVTTFLSERFETAEAEERAYRLFADYEGSVVVYKIRGDATHLDRFVNRAVAGLSIPISMTI